MLPRYSRYLHRIWTVQHKTLMTSNGFASTILTDFHLVYFLAFAIVISFLAMLTAWLYGWQCWSVGRSVHHFDPH